MTESQQLLDIEPETISEVYDRETLVRKRKLKEEIGVMQKLLKAYAFKLGEIRESVDNEDKSYFSSYKEYNEKLNKIADTIKSVIDTDVIQK